MFPGEFSIPLTDEARTNASNELEFQPKGIFAEVFQRAGSTSIGINGFAGNNERSYFGIAGQANCGNWYFEGGLGRAETQGAKEYRYSLTADWIRDFHQAYGVRIEHRQIAGQKIMISPYASWTFGEGPSIVRFIAEARFQRQKYSQFVFEVGIQF